MSFPCVIAYRLKDGPVQLVITSDGEVSEFPTVGKAEDYLTDNALYLSGQGQWQILELTEL